MDLDTRLEHLPKIGRYYSSRLENLGLRTVRDLLFHIPFRYEEAGEKKLIADLVSNEKNAISGTIIECRNLFTRYGKKLTFAHVKDDTGTVEAVWFNQTFLTKILKPGTLVQLSGLLGEFSRKPTLINPEYEIVQPGRDSLHTQGLVPIYNGTLGLSSKWLRSKIADLFRADLKDLVDPLPKETLLRNSLMGLKEALKAAHFPKDKNEVMQARRRLAFDELLDARIRSLQRKKEWKTKKSFAFLLHQEQLLSLISQLPFLLTGDQKKVLQEILQDLISETPMNRMLQGDVGSGKTVIAALAAYEAFLNGFQCVLMAPTSILAIQHFQTFKAILEGKGVRVGLFTSNKKPKGEFDVAVGTHALLGKNMKFDKLGLVIIDEQHRFGVEQRGALRTKGKDPHVLSMTATPIPRSLALTLFGDLSISFLEDMPSERKPVKTFVVPPEKRNSAYEFAKEHVREGEQVFIVCPLIEPSETLESVKSAREEFERLKNQVFPQLRLELLHGRLKAKEKEQILHRLATKEIDILVATPVVEVGIDIPAATIIIVEAAERFGIASLHQLRGRVGRRNKQGFCLLFSDNTNPKTQERLLLLARYQNGLKLAEADLRLRGPGQILGTLQSGLPEFKVASLADLKLIEESSQESERLFAQIESGGLPLLAKRLGSEKAIAPD